MLISSQAPERTELIHSRKEEWGLHPTTTMLGKNTYFIDEKDKRELARLQLQDSLMNDAMDLLPRQFVPSAGSRILDLACGPGGWALQVAHTYRNLSVVGVDISERMITYARAQAKAQNLENVQFSIRDILNIPWEFPDEHFHLVNARFIGSLMSVSMLPTFLSECQRVLQPGGIFRFVDNVHTCAPNSSAERKLTFMVSNAMYKGGMITNPYELATTPRVAQILKSQGYQNLTPVSYVIDISYGAPLYQPMVENWLMALELLEPFLLKTGVCTHSEFEETRSDYTREVSDKDFCGYYYLCSLSATKSNTITSV